MEKLKNFLIGIWGMFWMIATTFGVVDILKPLKININFSYFLGLLFSICSLLGIIKMLKKEDKH